MQKLSILVGALLLIAASILSYVSANNGAKMIAKKEATLMKYVDASDSALEDEDIKNALKYAKLAIQTDPKSQKGYICYKNAMDEKYQTEGVDTPQAEESDENFMGC